MANERARQLRAGQTDAERKLWRRLRVLKTDGFHFRRQVPIDHLIVDFACLSARLVIEVDGGQHNWEAGRHGDEARDAHLHRHGFKVLRFWNNEVMVNPAGVMERVRSVLGREEGPQPPTPTPPRKGEGLSPKWPRVPVLP
jgi:very-short-patch-repair endonuclease